jgi:DNA-directed RNA polymerase sigma subunit (sigma70/sigma32)
MATTKLKPKQTTKKILSPLKDRAFDVVVNRFGLSEDAKRKTLEAIGEKFDRLNMQHSMRSENQTRSNLRKRHLKKSKI